MEEDFCLFLLFFILREEGGRKEGRDRGSDESHLNPLPWPDVALNAAAAASTAAAIQCRRVLCFHCRQLQQQLHLMGQVLPLGCVKQSGIYVAPLQTRLP